MRFQRYETHKLQMSFSPLEVRVRLSPRISSQETRVHRIGAAKRAHLRPRARPRVPLGQPGVTTSGGLRHFPNPARRVQLHSPSTRHFCISVRFECAKVSLTTPKFDRISKTYRYLKEERRSKDPTNAHPLNTREHSSRRACALSRVHSQVVTSGRLLAAID